MKLIFRIVYGALARKGYCDLPGGAEYRRVAAEWDRAGRPWRIARFIRSHANGV
jgi:hypothetical protein